MRSRQARVLIIFERDEREWAAHAGRQRGEMAEQQQMRGECLTRSSHPCHCEEALRSRRIRGRAAEGNLHTARVIVGLGIHACACAAP